MRRLRPAESQAAGLAGSAEELWAHQTWREVLLRWEAGGHVGPCVGKGVAFPGVAVHLTVLEVMCMEGVGEQPVQMTGVKKQHSHWEDTGFRSEGGPRTSCTFQSFSDSDRPVLMFGGLSFLTCKMG